MNKTEQWTAEQARAFFAKSKQPSGKTTPSGNGSKAKAEMEIMLQLFGKPYETEFFFHPERQWRFDWAIPSMKVGIEYEGLMSKKSRHTTIKGFTGDTEKYNAAASLGWKVYRYTALNYGNLSKDLKKLK
jgi:hypothetical protein